MLSVKQAWGGKKSTRVPPSPKAIELILGRSKDGIEKKENKYSLQELELEAAGAGIHGVHARRVPYSKDQAEPSEFEQDRVQVGTRDAKKGLILPPLGSRCRQRW